MKAQTAEEKRARLTKRVEAARAASSRACARAERTRTQSAREAYSKARQRWLALKRELEALSTAQES